MYGQGNFGSQLQQGPHTVVPPFQQRPPGTFPPPPAPLQQGPPAPAHSIMPEASSAIRPQVGQLGPPLYQHTPPHQHTLVQQGPQVHGGMQSVGQSYLHPPPPTHVSVPLRQSYPSAQQSSQYPAHLGTQNMHHIPPRVLSTLGPPGSEIFLAPPPPRIPPPPPPPLQGQTLYRTLMPPVPGVVQGLHHGPLPPPPPPSTSSYFTPATYGSFVHSAPEGNTLSTAPPPPPPLPPSPPPLPPSPPPSASPLHGSRNSSTPILAVDFPSRPSSKKLSGSDLNASDSFDKVPAGNHMGDNMTISDGYRNRESGSDSVVGSIIKHGSTNESVVHKIDILCKSIAVNSPGFEDMACQKEYQSPGANDTRDSPLRPSEIESSIQPDGAKDAGGSLSLADSDMDMEDDIVQFDKEDAVHHSHEGPNPKSMMIHDGYDVKEQLAASKCPPLHNLFRNASPKNGSASVTSGLAEKVISSARAAERPSDKNLEISSTAGPSGSSPSNPLAGSAGTVYGKDAGKLSMSGSPFRLLQDYASEESSENNEPCRKDDSPLKSSPSVSVGNTSLNRDVRDCLEAGVGSKSSCGSEELQSLSQAIVASFPSMPIKPPYSPMESQMEVGKTIIRSVVAVQMDEQVDTKCKSQEFHHSATQDAFQEHNAVEGGNSVVVPERCKSVKEKCVSTEVKVDEFGRLVREGLSDSDSEDFHYTRRHGKRGRSRSLSLSPNVRRKRRNSLRRRERRSRSRSWSPRRRRSKSRSPINRRVGELGGKRMRQSRGRIPDCLDFLRGKCQRGASCRFLHNESDQSGGSRRQKSKFHSPEVPPNSQDTEIQEMQVSQDLHGGGFSAQRDQIGSDKSKVGSRSDSPRSIYSDRDVKLLETDLDESGRLRGAHAQVQETLYVQEEPTGVNTHSYNNDNYHKSEEKGQALLADRYSSKSVTEICTLKLSGDAAELVTSSALNTAFQQSQTSHSVPVLQNADHQPVSFISDISPDQTVKSSPDNPPVSVPLLDDIATTHSYTSLDSHSHPSSSDNPSYQLLPPPPPLPLPQGTNAPHVPQLPKDYNLIQPTVNLPFQSAPEESIPAYQAPLPGQHTHFSLPPNSTWTSLPPPPRPAFMNHLTVNGGTTIPGFPPKFLQNHLSQTSIRPHPTDLPNPSQVGDFQHRAYLPMQEHYQPSLHLEDYGSKHPPAVNSLAQPFAGPNLVRKDFSSGSYSHDNVHAESMPFLRESPTTKMQSFPGDDVPAAEHHKPSSQNHPFLRQQVPPYGLQHPAADNASVSLALHGSSNSSTSKISSDILERNLLPRLSDFVGSRVAAHYNPYASTFDQPLSSKFSSTAFRLEKDTSHGYRYDAALSSSHLPIDGQGVGSIGLRQISSSPKSARAIEKILPRTGGDQYDPLFDSIEPTSNSIRKYDNVQKHVLTGDSDITLRFSASHKPLDVEENNKKKEEGAVAADISLENDEFGETADAEVGAVENGSPSDPIDEVNTAPGEVEIDQIKSPGKSRRSKDSRSMKLFKVALADFVKEVLKPSWRQGNMSKEAFKTIVKKTVDKVSGAMKGHQIPKSQAKINHYIDSSQRKLTKLVMGYVDKYVKM